MYKTAFENNNPIPVVTIIEGTGLANELTKYCPTVMFRQAWDREPYNVGLFDGLDYTNSIHQKLATEMGYNFFFGTHFNYTQNLLKNVVVKHRNETGFHPLDGWFDLGIMQAANNYGIKVAICGDSLGTPELKEWQMRIPALEFAKQHNHYVTLNEYGPYKNGVPSKIDVSSSEGFEYFGGRHRMFWNSVPWAARPKLIIGETGSSDSMTNRGYTINISDMYRYNKELMKDDYVVGCCWWTFGTWYGFPNSSMDNDIPQYKEKFKTFGVG